MAWAGSPLKTFKTLKNIKIVKQQSGNNSFLGKSEPVVFVV